jgi:SAM-dependent methyltransferase
VPPTSVDSVPSLWLRIDDEAVACPACGSTRLTHLDAVPARRRGLGPQVAFLTGCRDCGLVLWNPLPSAEQLAQFYSRDGEWAATRADRITRLEAAHRRMRSRPKKRRRGKPHILLAALDAHVPVLSPPVGGRVLDVGCGDGKLLNALQDLGWDTYGIDPSEDVAFLRHRRLQSTPEDGSFDLVVLHHVLEHVAEPLALLRQVSAAVRPGGALFVSVPRLDTLPVHGDFRYCINERNHPLAFSEACLRGLLARSGFATTAALDDPNLDRALTDGQPLRLRLVGTRTSALPPLPREPLRPAVIALTRYVSSKGTWMDRWRRRLPVRLQGALLNRSRD